jgi:hypothetical protein
MPMFWTARSPFRRDGEDDGADGEGRGGSPSLPPGPRRPVGPSGIDWAAFDRARTRWSPPTDPGPRVAEPDRTPIGV